MKYFINGNKGEKRMKISIIVPIFNAEKTLIKCINSVLQQTYKNWELILINDGSTDNSRQICEKFMQRDERIHLVNKENGGSIKARQMGIDLCSGDYITFIDADDWINTRTLEVFIENLTEPFDIICYNSYKVIGRFNLIKRENRTDYFTKRDIYNKDLIMDELIAAWFYGHPFPATVWGKYYKRELLKKCYDTKYLDNTHFLYDDLMLNFSVFLNATSVKVINQSLYYYRYGGGTSRYMPYLYDDFLNAHTVQNEIISTFYDNNSEHQRGTDIMLLNSFVTVLSNLCLISNREEIKEKLMYYVNDSRLQTIFGRISVEDQFRVKIIEAVQSKNIEFLYNVGQEQYKKSLYKNKVFEFINNIF